MKRIFCLLAAVVLLGSVSHAQNINYAPGVAVYPVPLFIQAPGDTLSASDSTLAFFRAPFNMEIQNLQVITPLLADTGAAANAGVINLWKRTGAQGTPTVVTSATVLAVNTPYTGTPTTTALSRITQGQYVELGAILGTSDKLAGLMVFIWYIRY